MHLRTLILSLLLWLVAQTGHALEDRHLIIIQPGATEPGLIVDGKTDLMSLQNAQVHLSAHGREQVKQMAEQLLTHGFDNRSIRAVYSSTAKSALETCEILSGIGVITTNKIRMEHRLEESTLDDPAELFALYDEIEKHQDKGHIIFVTHENTATKLIESLTHNIVKLENAQPYILPLSQRIGT